MPIRFSSKLDIYRRLKSLTISELAEKVGCDAKHMEYLLTGEHQPKPKEVFEIMERLDIKFTAKDFEDGMP